MTCFVQERPPILIECDLIALRGSDAELSMNCSRMSPLSTDDIYVYFSARYQCQKPGEMWKDNHADGILAANHGELFVPGTAIQVE